jgi:hypothetical protein
MVHSGGSTSPLVTSSGPTILTCLLDSLARVTHPCVNVHSKAIQRLDFSQIYDADIFGVSVFRGFGHREFVHPHISNFHLPKFRNYYLLFHLIQWSSSSLTIYDVDHFGILGFVVSQLAKTRFFPFGFPGAEMSSGSHVSPRWTVPTNSGFRVSRFPCSCATQKGF